MSYLPILLQELANQYMLGSNREHNTLFLISKFSITKNSKDTSKFLRP